MTLVALGSAYDLEMATTGDLNPAEPVPSGFRTVRFSRATDSVQTGVFAGPRLEAGQRISVQGIVEEPHTTIAIPPGWQATLARKGAYVLERTSVGSVVERVA